MKVKLAACDLFNTLFRVDSRPKAELQAYGDHIKNHQTPATWEPWTPPYSWEFLPLFPDVIEAVELLRANDIQVVSMSNAPFGFTQRLLRNSDLTLDGITCLENIRHFKPHPACYEYLRDHWHVPASRIIMVTANRTFGDIEGARSLGMSTGLIRDPEAPFTDFLSLARFLV